MNLTVPDLTIACMIVSCVIAFGLPILLALYFHKKKGEFIPMIVGIAVMFVFVFTLEAAVNQTIFKSTIGETIICSLWRFNGGCIRRMRKMDCISYDIEEPYGK